jgi:protein phosphatase
VVPDEPATGAWPQNYQNGYTGAFDTTPFEADAFEPGDWQGEPGRPMRDTTAFERDGGRPGPGPVSGEPDVADRVRRPGGHRAGRRYDDDTDPGYGAGRGRRRWPIVTTALVLLVLLLGGGGYGFWHYNQSQYYVGVQNGFVSIFRGTDQSVAGISLSSLVQRSTLPVSELRSSDQAGLSATITQDSVGDAQLLIDQLLGQVDQCKQEWTAVAAWQTKNTKYQTELRAAGTNVTKKKAASSDNPGAEPRSPDAASCASPAALGVTGTSPAATPPVVPPSATPTPSPTGKSSAKASATPRAAA